MADALQVGSPAPAFALESQTGERVSLADFRGEKIVVLYFFPKANTPGCTLEACGFRDAYADLQAAGAVVLGVSPDTVAKQAKFAQKCQLPFLLLADVEHTVAKAYGVWKQKSFMGKQYMGVDRQTFLIDREGIIRQIFSRVTPLGHAKEVLAAIQALETKSP
jgi:peroxiredoxin Q/BCP